MKKISLSPGVVVEQAGGDVLVIVPGRGDALSLSGRAAEVVRSAQSGLAVVSDSVVAELASLGVVEVSEISRRGLMKAGAIGAGAGIAVLSMPTVAAAASEIGTPIAGGSLFASPWQEVNFPGLAAALTGLSDAFVANDWVGELQLVESPFTIADLAQNVSELATNPAPTGTVTFGEFTRTAYLLYNPAAGLDDYVAWYFKGEWDGTNSSSGVPSDGSTDFRLTFTFEGDEYRVVPE